MSMQHVLVQVTSTNRKHRSAEQLLSTGLPNCRLALIKMQVNSTTKCYLASSGQFAGYYSRDRRNMRYQCSGSLANHSRDTLEGLRSYSRQAIKKEKVEWAFRRNLHRTKKILLSFQYHKRRKRIRFTFGKKRPNSFSHPLILGENLMTSPPLQSTQDNQRGRSAVAVARHRLILQYLAQLDNETPFYKFCDEHSQYLGRKNSKERKSSENKKNELRKKLVHAPECFIDQLLHFGLHDLALSTEENLANLIQFHMETMKRNKKRREKHKSKENLAISTALGKVLPQATTSS